jgi:hypothetical protein
MYIVQKSNLIVNEYLVVLNEYLARNRLKKQFVKKKQSPFQKKGL